jgi:hypothetical protein
VGANGRTGDSHMEDWLLTGDVPGEVPWEARLTP